jgi:hypothetical protein
VKRAVSRLVGAAAASMALLALAPGAAPASTPSASLHFTNQATLQEDGTVIVSLVYLCNSSTFGGSGFVAARLEQGEPPAYGEAFAPAECNGEKHKVTLDLGPGPFSPGPGTAQAVVFNEDGSSHAETTAILKVK